MAVFFAGDFFLSELIEAQDDINKCVVADVSHYSSKPQQWMQLAQHDQYGHKRDQHTQ